MNFVESLKSAVQSIKGNKIRSFLTMLGIIIGISSVITMSSIGKGGQENITGDLKEGGYGKFNISIDKTDENFRWKYLLNEEIVKKLQESNLFKAVSPKISSNFGIKIGENNRRQMVVFNATTPDYEMIDRVKIIYGRNILPFEYENAERVVTIDNVTAKNLFGNARAALGKSIEIYKGRFGNPQNYKIVGVYQNPVEQMMKVMGGKRVQRFGRIPLSTYEKIYDSSNTGFTSIILETKTPENMAFSMTQAREFLENITNEAELYDINVENNGAASFDNILTTLNMFVTFVAGISLFVGGIGVMNIMLVSVVERTKEIGIRKAIGATDFDILSQFLMESIILTGIGGILGIGLGILLSIVVGYFIEIKPIFSILTILISLLVSMGIGIIFGVTPARKAARLNPVDALRAE
ncbi:Macrolide export ATP-binding/permease protein MacB [Fusobacterium necrogenes]|uniref:Macrolide export ATP-binding/permease protein MacB n=1 Tax=Fusobacterium necrogenes TaxID=858 RepID=A0A377GW49_9FUSO|nr:ABC transporter permease [Fusobacterium necrogenes]STO30992.1 Macrolide export ATP-binding/permease protein MacB [Fusobacterium necrogenes]